MARLSVPLRFLGPNGLRLFVLLAPFFGLGLFGMGCADGVSPQVRDFFYDGQAQDVSTVLLFTLEFADPNGDLSGGSMETFIGGSASRLPPLALQPLFLKEDLSLSATQGVLPFEVELSLGRDPSDWPEQGQSFEFGIRLTDEEGNFSDISTLNLTFSEVP